jgi:16S rRNA (uracil1498-N3)-methyltransferase
LPEIAPEATVAEAAERARAAGHLLLVAHPSAGAKSIATAYHERATAVALFVGPEGGLTADEADTLRAHDAQFVDLGPRVLRIETAVAALFGAINALTTGQNRLSKT